MKSAPIWPRGRYAHPRLRGRKAQGLFLHRVSHYWSRRWPDCRSSIIPGEAPDGMVWALGGDRW